MQPQQHPHQPPAARAPPAAAPGAASMQPDTHPVIIHTDADCFYAQVEERRNPSLRGQPVAVTQKYLIVTCNYAARAAGATKLMGIKEAKAACPNLVLVPGEDLTPYRAASRDMRAVLSRWGPTEKLGLDECWVDVTKEVDRRLRVAQAAGTVGALSSSPWCGHLVSSGLQLTAHSRHRPMDLRVVQDGGQQQQQQEEEQEHSAQAGTLQQPPPAAAAAAVAVAEASSSSSPAWLTECVLRLKLGAVIAAEMRQATKQETGFRFSAGIACSKLLSKLVSGLHKPDAQTTILPTEAEAFVAPLPVRALPGVGHKAETVLKAWGVATAADARSISKAQLVNALGDKHGSSLFFACRGADPSPVVASGPPKSITVEDSFRACSSWEGVAQVLQVLVPDLLERLREDVEEHPGRDPGSLCVKWRKAGTGWQRSSASAPWPAAAKQHASASDPAAAAAALTASATSLLKQHLPAAQGFNLSLLNVGATNFQPRAGGSAGSGGIMRFLQAVPKREEQAAPAAAAAAAQQQQQQAGPAAALPPPGVDLLQHARAATAARRDHSRASSRSSPQQQPAAAPDWRTAAGHSSSNGGRTGAQQQQPAGGGPAVMLSKRQERWLWELAMQQQAGGNQQQQPQPQHPQQQQSQQQQPQQHPHHMSGLQQQQPQGPSMPSSAGQQLGQLQGEQPSAKRQRSGCSAPQLAGDAVADANTTQAASSAAAAAGAGGITSCLLSTNLHSVDGWGLVACEVVEQFSDDDDEGDGGWEEECQQGFG